ncbi:MAG: hypothetical protein JST01_12595 [Cyanobacteria bacterium SZAS TMP-1]|nr:hypothetical protein [Cyanobacteria bacterium SZAS TMP-1]
MLHNVEEEARMKRILEVLDRHLQLSLKINEVVGRLSEKRVTLEEKMIRSYFHQVGGNMMELAGFFHRALASATTPKGNTTDGYAQAPLTGAQGGQVGFKCTLTTDQIRAQSEDFDQLLSSLESTIEELLKVLRYDLNFVEQYFEFNYYNKLTNEETFLADSQRLLDQFKKLMLG